MKKFFHRPGRSRAAGGITFSDNESDQFRSFCYTDPDDREFVKRASELAARHFDEIILDDFFFVTTKHASDIAAKGTTSWTRFPAGSDGRSRSDPRLGPAKAVNPRVKVVDQIPKLVRALPGPRLRPGKGAEDLRRHLHGNGERDPVYTDQFLQQYESYQIFRYFENIKPGGNGGGLVDT